MIPLEDFYRKPAIINVKLSPDGKHIAYLAPFARQLNLFVMPVSSHEKTRITSIEDRDISDYVWANNDRLIYLKDRDGDENTRLYAIGSDGSKAVDMTPEENVKCGIVDVLDKDDNHILVQMNLRNREIFDVYRLQVYTGELQLTAENPGNVSSWVTDHDGHLLLATTTDGVNTGILHRKTETDQWRNIATYNFKEVASPLFFTFDNQSIYVASNVGRDKSAIFSFELETGKETELIFQHPEVDVGRLLFSKKRKVITGVAFTIAKLQYRFFDDERERLQQFIDGKLPGYINSVTSMNRDETCCTVYSGSDRTRGSYYFCDISSMALTKMFDLSPWLRENDMAEMTPIAYPARDGLTIHGYLTLPGDREPASLPLVVHPHGGPWHRDVWGFDPTVQFLANRGFAVLQMNFRGSTGYGRAFMKASFKQWGLSMQDDITDGVQYLIDQGIANPQKIAIYGGSYGGYATLAGIVKTPGFYACAIDGFGVSNLFSFLETIPPYWKPYLEMMYEMVGHPEKDKQLFTENSPALNADKIKTPLMIVQGKNDPRVKKSESDQMVEALRSRGVSVEYLVKEDEGHGFRNEENMFDFYRAVEVFLMKHIPVQP